MGLGACATVPAKTPAEPWPPPGVVIRQVALQKGFLKLEIAFPLEPAGLRPVVIGSLGNDRLLLERGIAVVSFQNDWGAVVDLLPASAIEEPANEQPVGKGPLASPRPGVIGRGYFALVGLAARNSIPAIVDHLLSIPEIDPARIAIAGSSTRGFIALEALSLEPRLSAAAVRVACGDYHEFLRSSSLALAGDERWLEDGALVLEPDYEEELRAREPIRYAERLPPRPLLLLAGGHDSVIPRTCTLATALALARAYTERGVPGRFRFVLDPDAGHDLGAEAQREALRWWERWLLEPIGASR